MRSAKITGARAVALGAAGLAVLTGVTLAPSAAAAPAPLGTAGAAVPTINWVDCPEDTGPAGYQCARVDVPLSYQQPQGETISLALGRLPATDQAHKLGTLFFNPGGPGGGGRIPPNLSPALHKRFDIVGFDPRGTHASDPVGCSDDPADDAKLSPEFPITAAAEAKAITQVGQVTAKCKQYGGPLLGHMSTANVARDMDLLRQAVGDEQLTYLGYSYGSHLGEVYANLFPDKVRALVIDGVLQPQEWTTGKRPGDEAKPYIYRLGSFHGTETALHTYLADCAKAGMGCAFGAPRATQQSLQRKYDGMLAGLRKRPVTITDPDGQPFRVNYQSAVGMVQGSLYSQAGASSLAKNLQQIYVATTKPAAAARSTAPLLDVPQPRFARPEAVDSTGNTDGTGTTSSAAESAYNAWFNAVACADSTNPRDPKAVGRYARQAEPGAPGFASSWIYQSLPCTTWPVSDPDRYTGPWNKHTANPVLVIGNRLGDPATPHEDALATSRLLGSARLLSVNIYGHTAAYSQQSPCTDTYVDSYLIGKQLPPAGTTCSGNRTPFRPQPGG